MPIKRKPKSVITSLHKQTKKENVNYSKERQFYAPPILLGTLKTMCHHDKPKLGMSWLLSLPSLSSINFFFATSLACLKSFCWKIKIKEKLVEMRCVDTVTTNVELLMLEIYKKVKGKSGMLVVPTESPPILKLIQVNLRRLIIRI